MPPSHITPMSHMHHGTPGVLLAPSTCPAPSLLQQHWQKGLALVIIYLFLQRTGLAGITSAMGPPKDVHVALFKGTFGCHHFCRDHVKANPPLPAF